LAGGELGNVLQLVHVRVGVSDLGEGVDEGLVQLRSLLGTPVVLLHATDEVAG